MIMHLLFLGRRLTSWTSIGKTTTLTNQVYESMIQLLPKHLVSEPPNEVELSTQYLNAFLLPLFDDPVHDILFQ
ncbi:unnamed protein product [Absidia cylindrospora]